MRTRVAWAALVLVACDPDHAFPIEAGEAGEAERIASMLDPEVPRFPYGEVTECRVTYLTDGAVRYTETWMRDGEGRPFRMVRLGPGGARSGLGWHREVEGGVEQVTVTSYWRDHEGVARSEVALEEVLDEGLLIRSEHPRRYYGGAWTYDASGRLATSDTWDADGAVECDYRPNGQPKRCLRNSYGHYETVHNWDADDRYTGQDRYTCDHSELVFRTFHPSGAPEYGEGSWHRCDGASGSWTERWRYDRAGRPVGWGTDGEISRTWRWSGARPVFEGVWREAEDGTRTAVPVREWTWDEEGRLVEEVRTERQERQEWIWSDDDVLLETSTTREDRVDTTIWEGDCPASDPTLLIPWISAEPAPERAPRPYGE
jgi:hypothetical protein